MAIQSFTVYHTVGLVFKAFGHQGGVSLHLASSSYEISWVAHLRIVYPRQRICRVICGRNDTPRKLKWYTAKTHLWSSPILMLSTLWPDKQFAIRNHQWARKHWSTMCHVWCALADHVVDWCLTTKFVFVPLKCLQSNWVLKPRQRAKSLARSNPTTLRAGTRNCRNYITNYLVNTIQCILFILFCINIFFQFSCTKTFGAY